MNIKLIIILLLLNSVVFAQQEINVTINGENYLVYEGQNFGYITESGEKIVFNFKLSEGVEISPAETQTVVAPKSSTNNKNLYNDKLLQFNYPVKFNTTEKRLSQNVKQITMVNGNGGGIVIQEFATINPEGLLDDFLFHLLDGQAPPKFQKTNIKTANGKKLTGKSVTDFDGTQIQVYATGQQKQGVLIAIIRDDRNNSLTKIVETFIIK